MEKSLLTLEELIEKVDQMKKGAVSECVEIRCRASRLHDAIRSSGKVNDLIGRLFGEALPAIDLSHDDLARRHQRPEQHGGCFGAGQHGLRLDPSLELLVQALDRIRGADRFPLALRKAREGE